MAQLTKNVDEKRHRFTNKIDKHRLSLVVFNLRQKLSTLLFLLLRS